MKKKWIALLALVLLASLTLAGCAASTGIDESTINRPTTSAVMGETELAPTVIAADAVLTTQDESGNTVANDLNTYNTLPAQGADVTLTGAHTSGIKSICYRIDDGAQTVVSGENTTVTLPAGTQKLAFYVMSNDDIASQWAEYYFKAE